MRFHAIIPALAGLAAATSIEDGATFNLMALRSASDIHFASFNAALSSIMLKLPQPNATCDYGESGDAATFYLQDGEMYLYAASATPQQLFVDRSGMGKAYPSPPHFFFKKKIAMKEIGWRTDDRNRTGQVRLHHWRAACATERRARHL